MEAVMVETIAALFVGYLLGVLTVAVCVAAGRREELDPGHAGLFLVTDEERDDA